MIFPPSLFLWWDASDGLVRMVFVLLMLFSVISWSILFFKCVEFLFILHWEKRLERELLTTEKAEYAYPHRLPSMRVTRSAALFMQSLRRERILLENGLTFLATIGSASPFIGLTGTVWGIMHALQGLSKTTALSLDLVAGPVADALLATAFGLFTAIPAIFGYNLFVRGIRRIMDLVERNSSLLLNRR